MMPKKSINTIFLSVKKGVMVFLPSDVNASSGALLPMAKCLQSAFEPVKKNAVPMIASDKNVALSVVVIFLILFMAANYHTTVTSLHLFY